MSLLHKAATMLLSIFIALSFVSYPAQAEEQIVVNQGDMIKTDISTKILNKTYNRTMNCTLGYVDKKNHTGLYAGHCGGGKVGSIVKNQQGKRIGVVESTTYPEYGWLDYFNKHRHVSSDRATIRFDNNVIVGENKHSGNTFADMKTVKTGDTICSYGAQSKNQHCGKVLYKDRYDRFVVNTRNSGGIIGDSGGPSWIPGKGFIGVYTMFVGGLLSVFTR